MVLVDWPDEKDDAYEHSPEDFGDDDGKNLEEEKDVSDSEDETDDEELILS